MSRVLRALFLVSALVMAPGLASGQTPQQRIDAALRRAGESGVPVALLESKVAEGRAKGVPLDRIAVAVEQRFETLSRVRSSFGERQQLTPQELGVAADALQSGVSEAAVRTVSETAPRDRRAVAIAVLTQLVQMGLASETALDRVTDALERGGDALMNLPAQAQGRGRGVGGSPANPQGRGVGGDVGRGGQPASVPARGRSTEPPGRGRGGPPVP
jgi:hypothetical protein